MLYSCLKLVLFLFASFILYSCASTPEEEKNLEEDQVKSMETSDTSETGKEEELPEPSFPGRFREGHDTRFVTKLPSPILPQIDKTSARESAQSPDGPRRNKDEASPKKTERKSRISDRIDDEIYEIHLPDIELPPEEEISQEVVNAVVGTESTDRDPQTLGQAERRTDGGASDFSRGMDSIQLEPLENLSQPSRRTEQREELSQARKQDQAGSQDKTPRQTEASPRGAETVQSETEEGGENEAAQREAPRAEASPLEEEQTEGTQAIRPQAAAVIDSDSTTRSSEQEEEEDWQRIVLPPLSGQELIIEFPETGWIYLGEKDGKEAIEFQEKYRNDTGEVFVFSLEAPGKYYLRFQRQDLRRAEQENTELSLSLENEGVDRAERVVITRGSENRLELSESEEASQDQARNLNEDGGELAATATPREDAEIEGEPLEPGDYSRAEALYEDNKYEEALAEYRRQYTGDNPVLQNRISDILRSLDRLDEAAETYRKNAELPGTQGKKARTAMYEIARTLNDPELLEDSLTLLDERDEISIDKELLDSIEDLRDDGRIGSAINILERLEKKYHFSPHHDRILFLLGNMYELDSEYKSLKKALSYYEKLEEAYPVSEYWGPSQERIRYLNRHFIHIR